MLNQERVFEELAKHGVTFFTGVPDSYLNGFCNYALNNCGSRNIIAANEGNAVGIASGHYFASKEISLGLYAEQWTGEYGESSGKSCG